MSGGRILAIAALAGTLAIAAACGSDGENGAATPPSTFAGASPTARATSTAAPATAAVSETPAASATPPAISVTETPTEEPELAASIVRITAQNVLFDVTAPQAGAGTFVSFVFTNADAGVPHNIHVFGGDNAAAPSLGATVIENGPVTQMLDAGVLPAGQYYFQCDVHPSAMFGTLTLS